MTDDKKEKKGVDNTLKSKTTTKKTGEESKASTKQKKAEKAEIINDTNSTDAKSKEPVEDTSSTGEKSKEFFDEAKESISEGARIISEEAKRIEKIIGKTTEKFFNRIKGKTSEAIDTSADFSRDAYNKALEIIEKFKDKQETKKLLERKKELEQELGLYVYLTHTMEKTSSDDLFAKDDVIDTIKKIAIIEREIIKIADEA